MLAQNFLSAEVLRVCDDTYQALIQVLGMLERQELKYTVVDPSAAAMVVKHYGRGVEPGLFNMAVWAATEEHGCGTVLCIGGAVEALMRKPIPDFHLHGALQALFMAHYARVQLRDITVAQAAAALRNFLTTGDSKWDQVTA